MGFERENRYLVLKRKDLAQLSNEDLHALFCICGRIDAIRLARGVSPELECVVVESDWPDYEYVWGLIQEWVESIEDKRST